MDKKEIKNFKKGDHVVMHSCHEANLDEYRGKIWECITDSYLDKGKNEIVFLKGFSGAFFVSTYNVLNLVFRI